MYHIFSDSPCLILKDRENIYKTGTEIQKKERNIYSNQRKDTKKNVREEQNHSKHDKQGKQTYEKEIETSEKERYRKGQTNVRLIKKCTNSSIDTEHVPEVSRQKKAQIKKENRHKARCYRGNDKLKMKLKT